MESFCSNVVATTCFLVLMDAYSCQVKLLQDLMAEPETPCYKALQIPDYGHGKDEVISSILIKGSTIQKAPLVGAFCIVAYTQSRAGHFPPCHGCALAASADSFAVAEPSQARSTTVEAQSVRSYASTAEPEQRRRLAKVIRPPKSRHGKDEVKFDSD